MNKSHFLPLAVTAALGLCGAGLVAFAWELPPFSPSLPTTQNAYVRGKVTSLSPQVAGYVAEVLVSDFQAVKEGQVLFRLDEQIFQQKLLQAQAGLAVAHANRDAAVKTQRATELSADADVAGLEAARLALHTAQTENDRQHSLQDRGILSTSVAEQADLSLSRAHALLAEAEASFAAQQEKLSALRSQVAAAEASIAQAEASVELAKLDLAHTKIVAPSDGTLGQVGARVGHYVSAATALASHVSNDRWVIANFTETSFKSLSIDQPVLVSVDALGRQTLSGHIRSFSPATGSEFSLVAGSNATGNFTKVVQRIPARIEIDAGQPLIEALLPGMSVSVTAQEVK